MLKPFGLFPYTCTRRDPPNRLHTNARSPHPRTSPLVAGDCAQPRKTKRTSGSLPHGPIPPLPTHQKSARVFFSRDDTELHTGSFLGAIGTAPRGWLLRRRGLPGPVQGGDNHKLQGGANHHQLPQARVIQAMAPAAAQGSQQGRPDRKRTEGRQPVRDAGLHRSHRSRISPPRPPPYQEPGRRRCAPLSSHRRHQCTPPGHPPGPATHPSARIARP